MQSSEEQIVLITGASGFVGKALCAALLGKKINVRGLVRDQRSLKHLPVGVEGIAAGDLQAVTDWKSLLTGVDCVVHLAARVHQMKEDTSDPETAYHQMNVEVTCALAVAAHQAGVKRFVFISSVKAMGEITQAVGWNELTPCSPQDAYGRSKLNAEKALATIRQETGLDIVIFRIPVVYGPGVKANVARLFKVVDKGLPLPFRSIKNQRSFLYVGNLVEAICVSIVHPNARGETFLVSDAQDLSTAALVRHIANALKRPARLLPIPAVLLRLAGKITGKSAELERLLDSLAIDTQKIQQVLSWQPTYTVEEGFKLTANWWREKNKKIDVLENT